MRGFPKHVATKADLAALQTMFPAESEALVKRLEAGRFVWEDAGLVGSKEVITETDDLKVIENKTETGVIECRKLVRVEDPNAQFFKLGLKVGAVDVEAVGSVEK